MSEMPSPEPSNPQVKGSLTLQILIIVAIGLLAYMNTFDAPFQWDDRPMIAENPVLKDLAYFLEPSMVEGNRYYGSFRSRYVGYLTFALNYKVGGLKLRGYHVLNLAVHIFNALFLYSLVLITFKAPLLEQSRLKQRSRSVAFLSAVLFVSHPVQTEAVTYVFQRFASLMAFFYLLSLLSYIGSCIARQRHHRYALYALSLVSAVLAMKTKENAFTLPLVMALYDALFLRGPIKGRMMRLMPLFATSFIIPLSLTGTEKPLGEIIGGMGSITRGYEGFTQWEYLLTQFRVVVTYLRLLFFPVNQNILYDYPVFGSFLEPEVILSFLFLLLIVLAALCLLYRWGSVEAGLRLTAFGVLWFFIALSVESGMVPIPMIINEYRVYLPSAGFFTALASGAFLLLGGIRHPRLRTAALLCLVLLPAVLASASYARNALWRSGTTLWEDTVRKSPRKSIGHTNLGLAYMSGGMEGRAAEHFTMALELNPSDAYAHYNLGILCRGALNLKEEAVKHYRDALAIDPSMFEAHYRLGLVYLSEGELERAQEEFQAVAGMSPGYLMTGRFLRHIKERMADE
jgi:hypothetical protein